MSKYKEALNYLFDKYANSTEEDSFLHRHYIDVLRELVDKATPMKPINTIRCANCGGNKVKEYLTDVYENFEGILNYSYCGDCGQKLDWSEDE